MLDQDAAWIEEFSIYLAEQIEGRPIPAPVVAVVMPEEDAPDQPPAHIGEAEGQYFMIDYRDARGQISTRRITVRGVMEGARGATVLAAVCHERKAYRQFRVDRIAACYDLDGVVHDDVGLFLFDTLGIPVEVTARAIVEPGRAPKAAKPAKPASAGHVSWNDLRRIVKHRAILFAALSHSDGEILDEEIDIALRHCAEAARVAGHEPSDAELERLDAYIRRLRPDREAIAEACALVFLSATGDPGGFLLAASQLVDADGKRHPEEIALLEHIAAQIGHRSPA